MNKENLMPFVTLVLGLWCGFVLGSIVCIRFTQNQCNGAVKTDTTYSYLKSAHFDLEPKTITDNVYTKISSNSNMQKLIYEMDSLDKSDAPAGMYVIRGDTMYVQRDCNYKRIDTVVRITRIVFGNDTIIINDCNHKIDMRKFKRPFDAVTIADRDRTITIIE